jgi:hypothetical protein
LSSLWRFVCCLFSCSAAKLRAMASSFTRFLDHTRRATVGRTPLDKWSARRRDLYLTTHNTHNRKTSMSRGIQTHDLSRRAAADLALDRLATVIGLLWRWVINITTHWVSNMLWKLTGNGTNPGRYKNPMRRATGARTHTHACTTSLDTTRPSTILYRLLLNWASLKRH